MRLKFDHIGVVVPTLAKGRAHLQGLLAVESWTQEFEDPNIKVWVQFGTDRSGVCYELIAPIGEASPVLRALREGSRILNHVAYLTPDLDTAERDFRSQRCVPVGEAQPAVAYGGKRVQFFVSPLRFMVELIESYEHEHDYSTPVTPGRR